MNIDLINKRALVCGASKGIGRAIAIQLAAAGATLTLVARNKEELEAVRTKLYGTQHRVLVADFSDTQIAQLALEKEISRFPVTILVNNTGGPAPGAILDASWDQFKKSLHMHLQMSHLLSRMVIPEMRKAAYGRIINIISTSVKIPIPGLGVSNTIRGAMASWAKTLAAEVAPSGITVNNILPGFIDTGRLHTLIENKAIDAQTEKQNIVNNMQKSIPAGRFGQPEELGYYAAFLASEYAGYITGTSLPIDGGRTGSL